MNAPKNAYNVQWVTRRGKMIFQGAWTLLFTYITIFLKINLSNLTNIGKGQVISKAIYGILVSPKNE